MTLFLLKERLETGFKSVVDIESNSVRLNVPKMPRMNQILWTIRLLIQVITLLIVSS